MRERQLSGCQASPVRGGLLEEAPWARGAQWEALPSTTLLSTARMRAFAHPNMHLTRKLGRGFVPGEVVGFGQVKSCGNLEGKWKRSALGAAGIPAGQGKLASNPRTCAGNLLLPSLTFSGGEQLPKYIVNGNLGQEAGEGLLGSLWDLAFPAALGALCAGQSMVRGSSQGHRTCG